MTEQPLHREIAQIAVPVSLETVFQLLLGFIDQVIVSTLGTVALAAVGLSNSILTVVFIALGALGAAAGILVARAHGGGRSDDVSQTSSSAAVLAAAVALLVALPLAAVAAPFLRALGAAPAVVAGARSFFPVVLLCSPLGAAGGVASATLRSLGRARATLATTLIAVVFNTALAWLLVLGIGPFPRLGLAGAAYATCAAQCVKTLLLFRGLYGGRQRVGWALPPTLTQWRDTGADLLRLATPLATKDVSWSLALFLYTLIFQRISTDVLAASQIVTSLENIFFLGSVGLMIAASTLVAQAVGQGDGHLARSRIGALLRAGAMTGIGFGLAYMGTALLLPLVYPHVGPSVRAVAGGGIVLCAVFQPVRVRNMILGGGVLPGAGDARSVVVGDGLGAFAVGLPLACLLTFGLQWGAWGVFAARGVEEVSKAFYFARRVRLLSWPTVAVGFQR